jgi:holin-like protein
MLAALTQLLLFQLAGEITARGLDLPVPGPVLGMLFLLISLFLRDGPDKDLQSTSQNLLQHLSLLFIPAGAGVLLHLHRLEDEWLPIVVALVASTLLGMAATALTMKLLSRPRQQGGKA